MESFSFWHLMIIIAIIIEIIPTICILQRAGLSGWWAILIFIPLTNLVALWIFAVVHGRT